MPNLNTISSSATIRAVVYGQPKSGKTAAVAALAASGYKLTVLSMENSIDTFLNPSILPIQYRENVRIIQIPDTQENPIASATVASILAGTPTSVCHEHGVVSCVKCKGSPDFDVVDINSFGPKDVLIPDSITQLADSVRNNINRASISKNVAPGWPEYNQEGIFLSRIFNRLQNLPCHLFAVAHEELVELQDGNKRLVPSAGTRNFAKGVAGFFTTVVQAQVVNRKYRLFSSILDTGNAVVAAANGHRLIEGEGLDKLFPKV